MTLHFLNNVFDDVVNRHESREEINSIFEGSWNHEYFASLCKRPEVFMIP